jgi:hypothetical protein
LKRKLAEYEPALPIESVASPSASASAFSPEIPQEAPPKKKLRINKKNAVKVSIVKPVVCLYTEDDTDIEDNDFPQIQEKKQPRNVILESDDLIDQLL